METGLAGKRVLVTGASGGIGGACAREFAAEGRFTLAKRFHGAPTNRSQRVTLDTDAPEILARCRQDQVDAALLVPT